MKQKIYSIYKYFKKHKILGFFVVFIILITPIITIDLLFRAGDNIGRFAINTRFQANDLLSFTGSLLGAFISGIVTFLALYITIQFEKEDRKEDRRLKIYPYLNYTVERDMRKVPCDDFLGFGSTLHIGNENQDSIASDHLIEIEYSLIVENNGLNSAIDLAIIEMSFLDKKDISHKYLGHIKVGETRWLRLKMKVDPVTKGIDFRKVILKEKLDVKLAYTNITGDYYEQKIQLSIKGVGDSKRDGIRVHIIPVNKTNNYIAYLDKHGVSKPVYYKDKTLLHEGQEKTI